MRDFLRARYGSARGPDHVWCGVSIEDGLRKSRLTHLKQAPAGKRFLSIEPLIGPVGPIDLSGIDWVIVGGESGPAARAMDPEWAREIRDQCVTAGVAFFFKQWGGIRPKTGGRTLDGRHWDQFPVAEAHPFLLAQRSAAENALIAATPEAPARAAYRDIWPKLLAQHVVKKSDLNAIASGLRKDGRLIFLNWEERQQVPHDETLVQRPKRSA